MNIYEFYTGKEFEAYKYLGAHVEGNEVVFRTFAPGAMDVKLIGECTEWNEWQMYRIHDGGFLNAGLSMPGRECYISIEYIRRTEAIPTIVILIVLEWRLITELHLLSEILLTTNLMM